MFFQRKLLGNQSLSYFFLLLIMVSMSINCLIQQRNLRQTKQFFNIQPYFDRSAIDELHSSIFYIKKRYNCLVYRNCWSINIGKPITNYIVQILQKKIVKMYQKYSSRRFQRNQKLLSPSSHMSPSNSFIAGKQLMSPIARNRSDSGQDNYRAQQKNSMFEMNGNDIVERLSMIEGIVESERCERIQQHNKLIKMIKDMQCKHTAIIYDSQIRYFKSPPKLELYTGLKPHENKNQKDRTLKKISSSYALQKNVGNIKSQQNIQNDTVQKSPVNSNSFFSSAKKLKTESENILNMQSQDANPERVKFNAYLSPIQLQLNKQKAIQAELQKRMFQKIKLKIFEEVDYKISQSLSENNLVIHNRINQLDQFIKYNLSKTNEKTVDEGYMKQLQHQIEQTKKNMRDIYQILTGELKQTQNSSKNNFSLIISQINYKIQQIENVFKNFSSPFQKKLQQVTSFIGEQTQQINRIISLNQFNHNIYSNKIEQISKFLNDKFDSNERQRQKLIQLEKQKQKDLQAQKARQRSQEKMKQKQNQQLHRSIEEKICQKMQVIKITSSKELQYRSEKLQQQLLDIIQKHILYVQNFIKKIAEKEEIIMRKYNIVCQRTSPGESWYGENLRTVESENGQSLDDSRSAGSAKHKFIQHNYQSLNQRYEALLSQVKSNYQQLSHRNTEIQTTVSGVIQALNDVIAKVKRYL